MKSSVVKRMRKDIVSGSFVPANAGMFLFLVCVLFLPSESFGGHHEQGRYDATNGYGERYELVFRDQDGGSWGWGQSVDISGDVAVVGSGEDNSVHVFDRNSDGTWSQSQKFSSSAADTRFGEAVAISGGTIVVGDHYEESVTVYERSTNGVWLQSQKLSSSVVADTNFGQSVAISGDKIIVGEDSEDSAYIYEKSSTGTWVLKRKFTVSVSSRDFGYSVAISGNRAIVGAPTAKTFCEEGADAAYVYERNAAGTWSQSQVLTTGGENLRCLTGFGHDVGISGDSLIVGSPSASHIFERNAEGNYVLTTTTSHTSARRGYIVALSGDKALTGPQNGVMIRVMKKADRVWLTNSWILHMRDLETATRLSKKYKVTDAGISGDRAIVLFGNSSDEQRMFVYELTEAGTARTQPVVNEEGPEAGTDPGTPGDDGRPEAEPGAPGTGEPPGGVEGAGHLEDILSRNGNAPGGQLSQSGGCAIFGGNEPAGGALSALAILMLTLTPLYVGRFRERGKRFPSEKQATSPV